VVVLDEWTTSVGCRWGIDGHGDAWVDVMPVTGALPINIIGDVLKVLQYYNHGII
jgi:hypothetical protein